MKISRSLKAAKADESPPRVTLLEAGPDGFDFWEGLPFTSLVLLRYLLAFSPVAYEE